MIKYLTLPFKLILYNISKKINKVLIYPFSYTYSLTSRCDSRCKTCNIWKKKEKDLTLNEWKKIIIDIGNKPLWITITGGNQFLRKDFSEIIDLIIKYNKPEIINIPVSGTMPKLIEYNIKKILSKIKKTKLILNISLDGLNKTHDKIRGKTNSFKKTLETIKVLKKLQLKNKNLIIGTYTTISRYNIFEIKKLKKYIEEKIKPDNIGFELAEIREEYKNQNNNFFITKKESIDIIKNILKINNKSNSMILNIKNIIRNKYYKYVLKQLNLNKEIIPCYCAIASIEISSTGEIWQCANKANSIGNINKNKFKNIFFSKKANEIRNNIKKDKCFCTHSNPFYVNHISEFKF